MNIEVSQESQFTFSSRLYGFALLLLLGVYWLGQLRDFLVTAVTGSSLQTLASESPDSSLLAAVIAAGLFAVACSLTFPVWTYMVHRDFRHLSPIYPISPLSAVAQVAVPLVNIVGLWNVFSTIAEENVPDLKKWVQIMYGLMGITIVDSFAARVSEGESGLLQLLPAIALTPVWFIIVLKVHRSLAALAPEPAATGPRAAAMNAMPAPAKANEADMTVETVKPGGKRRSSRWLWYAMGGIGLAAIALIAVRFITPAVRSAADWFDDDYFRLGETLVNHFHYDEDGADLWIQFSWFKAFGGETQVWLNIEMETQLTCSPGPIDPCEQLADEIARLTLEEYGRLDELAGLFVQITTVDADWEDSGLPNRTKEMTIDEWRRELELESGAG